MVRILSLFILLFSASASSNTLLVLGDSLSAGYQMAAEQSWPSLLPQELNKRGFDYDIINASISGDTTGNGLARLPELLEQHSPDYLLIELGANDGLRGFHPKTITNNLNQIILAAQNSGSEVLLMQIEVPPNYGKRYSQAFTNIFPEVANNHQTPLLPFFLEHVILKEEWMLSDGLHPNEDAQPWIAGFMADNLALYLK